MTRHLYFAFGMNMDPETMDYLPGPPIPLGRACLPDWGLRMRAFADIEEAPGEVVYGVLWELTPEALLRLDQREGYQPGGFGMYDRREVTVLDRDGQPEKAIVYFMTDRSREWTQRPASEHYLGMLRQGYAHFGHGPEAVASMEKAQADATPPRTFWDDFHDHYPDGLARHPDAEED